MSEVHHKALCDGIASLYARLNAGDLVTEHSVDPEAMEAMLQTAFLAASATDDATKVTVTEWGPILAMAKLSEAEVRTELALCRRRALSTAERATVLCTAVVAPGRELFNPGTPLDFDALWVSVIGTTMAGVATQLALTVVPDHGVQFVLEAAAPLPRWDVQDYGAVQALARSVLIESAARNEGGVWWIDAPHGGEPSSSPQARLRNGDGGRGDARWVLVVQQTGAALLQGPAEEVAQRLSVYQVHRDGIHDLPLAIEARLFPVLPDRAGQVGSIPDMVLLCPAGRTASEATVSDLTDAEVRGGSWAPPGQPVGDA